MEQLRTRLRALLFWYFLAFSGAESGSHSRSEYCHLWWQIPVVTPRSALSARSKAPFPALVVGLSVWSWRQAPRFARHRANAGSHSQSEYCRFGGKFPLRCRVVPLGTEQSVSCSVAFPVSGARYSPLAKFPLSPSHPSTLLKLLAIRPICRHFCACIFVL